MPLETRFWTSAVARDLLASLPAAHQEACAATTLNPLMALGPECWSALRARLSDLLRADHPHASDHQRSLAPHLFAMAEATMLKPALIGNYTDFYASIHHATNVGRLFRPENPLLPNYKYVPIGYHGRASSIRHERHAREAARRARLCPPPGRRLTSRPPRRLITKSKPASLSGPATSWAKPSPSIALASHLFGVCLLNDWSARDIQAWEYQPLGPFLAKSFATTISPWVVTMEALAPFRTPAFARPPEDPRAAALPGLGAGSCKRGEST